jgi:hypothetical protein
MLFIGPMVRPKGLSIVARGWRAGDLVAGSPLDKSVSEACPHVPEEEPSDEPEDDSQDYPTDPTATGIGNGDENGLHVNSIRKERCASLGPTDMCCLSPAYEGRLILSTHGPTVGSSYDLLAMTISSSSP